MQLHFKMVKDQRRVDNSLQSHSVLQNQVVRETQILELTISSESIFEINFKENFMNEKRTDVAFLSITTVSYQN